MPVKIRQRRFRVSTAYWPRREFDPNKTEDLAEYKHFLQKQTWRDGCPFVLEWPFLTVTSMIEHKITRNFLSKHIKLDAKKKTPRTDSVLTVSTSTAG